MSTDTDDLAETDTAEIHLDITRYTALFALLGCTTTSTIATETGLTQRHVRRVLRGAPVGEVFMVRSIAALQRRADELAEYGHSAPTLDDLFTVAPARAA